MLRHGYRRAIWALEAASAGDDRSLRLDLAAEALGLLVEHEAIWQDRCQPGGLVDSQARLLKISQAYSDDQR